MANCDLTLRLDDDGAFEAGTTVRGSLLVRADGDVHVDGSKVALAFETRGPGNKHRGDEIVSLGEAFDLKDGEELSIAFALELPREPITMSGTIVSVVWGLRATLDVPWAFDPKAELEIEVVAPSRTPTSEPSDPDEPVAEPAASAPRSTWSRAAPYVLGVLIVAIFLIRLESDQLARKKTFGSYQLILLAVGVGYVTWRFGGRHFLNRFAARTMGEPEVHVASEHAHRGASLGVTVTMAPPTDFDLAGISARAVCTETAYSGGGRDRRTREHRTEGDLVHLAGATSLSRSVKRTFTAQVVLPPDASPTFDVPSNHIGWEIEIRVIPKSGVDHMTATPLHIDA